MLAKIKKTGEIITVKYIDTLGQYKVKDGRLFLPQELVFPISPVQKNIDWEQRRFELVKSALQGMLANPITKNIDNKLVDTSILIADVVIEKLKEE